MKEGNYFFFDKITPDENIKFIRLGLGKAYNRWFVRVDLWSVGFRLSYGRY